jgi:hypothetical protein
MARKGYVRKYHFGMWFRRRRSVWPARRSARVQKVRLPQYTQLMMARFYRSSCGINWTDIEGEVDITRTSSVRRFLDPKQT